MTKEQPTTRKDHILSKWKIDDIPNISRLEQLCWAPWIRRPANNFAAIIKRFPEGQLLYKDQATEEIISVMTANRINWNGQADSLGTWDSVVGRPSDYSTTYLPNGNTLCMVSSSVDPDRRDEGLSSGLIREMNQLAKELGVKYLIGPFRPSDYGKYKLEEIRSGREPVGFEEYCDMTRVNPETGLQEPLDHWLRAAARLGMKPLKAEEGAMTVDDSVENFNSYKETYNPEKWIEVRPGVWECGETGTWHVNDNVARYIEPNLWGEVPIK